MQLSYLLLDQCLSPALQGLLPQGDQEVYALWHIHSQLLC